MRPRNVILLFVFASEMVFTESAAAQTSLEGCPAWIGEYVKLHASQRLNESAPRVTWTDQDENSGGGAAMGYGDRIRALVYTLRVAAATDRYASVCRTSTGVSAVSAASWCFPQFPFPGARVEVPHPAAHPQGFPGCDAGSHQHREGICAQPDRLEASG